MPHDAGGFSRLKRSEGVSAESLIALQGREKQESVYLSWVELVNMAVSNPTEFTRAFSASVRSVRKTLDGKGYSGSHLEELIMVVAGEC